LLPARHAPGDAVLRYGLRYRLALEAGAPVADASITLSQTKHLLREARFRAPAARFSDFEADGDIRREDDRLIWTPPEDGGSIRYRVLIDHHRSKSGYDALVEPEWAVFRFDDIFPAARTRHRAGAESLSTLELALPERWSVVTPYSPGNDGTFTVVNATRRFDRPTGWVIAGRLGIRKDFFAGFEIVVAGPVGLGIQRIPMLALLRWTLPHLADRLQLDEQGRITVIVAPDPMWRGGLSASNSVFLHADRPLISENGTSTLLHELAHVIAPVETTRDADWIDEGIAEYLALRTLRDTGTISDRRFEHAISGFRRRAADTGKLSTGNARGSVRARAVALLFDLDRELDQRTDGRADIFSLTRALMASGQAVSTARLRKIAADTAGGEVTSLPTPDRKSPAAAKQQ